MIAPPVAPIYSSPTSLKVLVIEDEAMVAIFVEDVLADLGHEVVATVGRLNTATKLVTELPIDIAIVDVNLNGEKSYPLAVILARRRIPFVFSTGYGTAGLDEEWKHIPTILKPFQPHQLAEAIARAVPSHAGPQPVS